MKAFLMAAAWLAVFSLQPVHGQGMDERVAKLRECTQLPTDPDAERRFVGLQEILKTGDPDCKERGIRAALTVADTKLQGVALSGFVLSFNTISLDIIAPQGLAELAAAALQDPNKANELSRKNASFGAVLRHFSGKVVFHFVNDGPSKFKVRIMNHTYDDPRYMGEASLRGSAIYGRAAMNGLTQTMDFELRVANGKIVGKINVGQFGAFNIETIMYP